MDTFVIYVRQLVSLMIFSTMLVNLASSAKYKKYLRLVLGMLLILSILRPILLFQGSVTTLDFRIEEYMNSTPSELDDMLERAEQLREKLINEDYQKALDEFERKTVTEGTVHEHDVNGGEE